MTITMDTVLNNLNIYAPQGRNSFDIICPSCGKKKLNINVVKGVFCCAKCAEGGGPVALYAFMRHGITPTEYKNSDSLYKNMRDEIRGGIPSDYIPKEKPTIVERIDVDVADVNARSNTYNAFLDILALEESHKENLIKRGLPEELISKYKYKSVPMDGFNKICANIQKDGHELSGTPGFFMKSGKWTIQRNTSGFFIPVKDIQGRIQGMQIRFDDADTRYKWFTSTDKEKGSKAKTWPHFVGYPEETVFLTEGPLKADIINYFMDVPVVAIPGVNATANLIPMLDELKGYGVKKICTAFDMDFLSNIHVEKAYVNLVTLLKEKGFTVKSKHWDPEYKGLDDFLLHKKEGDYACK